jgi:outer membrane lipoprotein-sorting protein
MKMNDNERQFEDFVSNIKFDDAPDVEHRDKLEQTLLHAIVNQSRQKKFRRMIMKSRITKLAAAAVIIIALIFGISYLDTPIDGASTVYAAAMDRVKQARTFSCISIFEMGYEDNGHRGKYLMKQKWMFKEPDRERHERLTSAPPWPQYKGEVTISHYGKRQRLEFRPSDKTAKFHDMSSDYEIDQKTGELRLTQLDTKLRDRLLKLSAGAVEDLGRTVLDGKSVRMLQSRKDKRITTVWVDPETSYPIQIEHKWTDQKRSPVMYTSIQIDTELDDSLFSLEPPEGYTLRVERSSWPDDKAKVGAKVMRLGVWCWVYASNNDDQFPDDLADIVKGGVITEEVLNKVLASPDDPDGPPVIRYRKPDKDAERSSEVILFEIFDQEPQDRVVASFADGHAELLPVQTLVQLLKPWPEYKKKLSVKMTHLHWLCKKYAKEHEGQYPGKLEDLVGGEFSDEAIKRLRAAPGESEGPVMIQYRPPHADAELSTEVILFEIYDRWPNDGAVVCFADGNCELIGDQNRFEELIK